MRTRLISSIQTVLALAVIGSAFMLVGCEPQATTSAATSASNSPSSAFFSVPASLSGDTTARAVRTTASDTLVSVSVSSYYAYVRDQVKFAAGITEMVKDLIGNIEAVKWGNGYLLDQNISELTGTGATAKLRWKTLATGSWSLEWWKLDGTKVLELAFTKSGDHYKGTVIINGAAVDWGLATTLDAPDMLDVAFDSDSDGAGTATLTVRLEDFRAIADIDDGVSGGEEDMTLFLSKSAAGTVSVGSVTRVANSRHFVYNGYDYLGALNTGSTAETRYYCAAGQASAAGLATLYLGIPTAVASDAFSNYGVGDLIATLMADRLNKDYAFNASAANNGRAILLMLNTIPGVTPSLDTTTYVNTPAAIRTALGQAKTWIDTNMVSGDAWVDYLVSMMAIENPGYFNASTYTGFGTTAPASGYPSLSDAAAYALLPASSGVDALASGGVIVFATPGTPGF